jgi:ribosomal protein S18 acetylase RimI-like enzyme
MDLLIRHAEQKDIPRILEIQKKAFVVQAEKYDAYDIPPMVESPGQIKLESEKIVVLVAEINGEIAGSVRVAYGTDDAEIKRLSVAEEFQKKGIGSRLMMEAEKYCEGLSRIWLFTGGQSFDNINLYKKLGYSTYKEEPWKDNFTLIYLEKHL